MPVAECLNAMLSRSLARVVSCVNGVPVPACRLPGLAGLLLNDLRMRTKIWFSTSSLSCATSTESGVAEIFDRKVKRAQRDRAAYARKCSGEDLLQAEIAERLLDRLEDCKRAFPLAAVLGGAGESIIKKLGGGRAGIEEIHYLDQSPAMLSRVQRMVQADEGSGKQWPKVHFVAADEEYLPLRHRSVDVIITCLGLHWVNDVPGSMTQCRRALKPDGLFLAAMWGGNTLQELRIACMMAEEATEGGVSQRVSPLAQVRDAGNLLTRAGLTIPSVDVDEVVVHYKGADELVHHLRCMGESNAVKIGRPRFQRRTWEATKDAYERALTEDERQSAALPATYEAIYMTGWAPHDRQQQPSARGSATASFQDIAKAL